LGSTLWQIDRFTKTGSGQTSGNAGERRESGAFLLLFVFAGRGLELLGLWLCQLAAVRKTDPSFLEFSLCLSRACLGKMINLMYKWLKNAGFRRRETCRHCSASEHPTYDLTATSATSATSAATGGGGGGGRLNRPTRSVGSSFCGKTVDAERAWCERISACPCVSRDFLPVGCVCPELVLASHHVFRSKFKLKRKERCCVFGFSLGLR